MEVGKTKAVVCIECGKTIQVSKFASAKTARCEECKKKNTSIKKTINQKVNGGLQDGRVIKEIEEQEEVKMLDTTPEEKPDVIVATQQDFAVVDISYDTTDTEIHLNRNRSEIEGTVVYKRTGEIQKVPVIWSKSENKLDYLSVSKIKAFEQCPAKFYDLYISGEFQERDSGNIYTRIGTILHNTVEDCERAYWDTGLILDPITTFNHHWQQEQCMDLETYKECSEIIRDFFMKNPVGGRAYKPLSFTDEHSNVHSGIEYEFRGYIGDALFGCKFDYIGEMINKPEIGIIADYKSNRVPFTVAQLESDLQLSIYEYIARHILKIPKSQWITGFEMFRFGWQECPSRNENDMDDIFNYIQNVFYQIIGENKWEERLNNYCGYCHRRHKCKTYHNFINNPNHYIQSIAFDPNSLSSIEKNRELMIQYEKICKTRKDELKKQVQLVIEQNVRLGQPTVIDGKQVYLQAQSRPYYNYSATKDLLAVNGNIGVLDSCLSINKTKLEKEIKNVAPELQLELRSKCMVQTYTAPYIQKRKYKG